MWLKLLLCGLVIAFCAALGYFAAGKYRARKSFFTQLYDLNEKYLSELKFRRMPLPDFLSGCKFTGDFQKTVESFLAKQTRVNFSYLTEEEKADALTYFGQLGRGDSRSQLGFFEGKRAMLSERKETCAKESKERGELYLKLGILAGLAFVILIV